MSSQKLFESHCLRLSKSSFTRVVYETRILNKRDAILWKAIIVVTISVSSFVVNIWIYLPPVDSKLPVQVDTTIYLSS